MQGPLIGMRRDRWQALARIIGTAATLAALAFWAQRIWALIAEPGSVALGASSLTGMIAAALLYCACQFLLVVAWQRALLWFGARASFPVSMAVYGKTLIAKYLPGNVFHLAGRHLVGAAHGLPQLAVLGATVYEILGLGLTATMLGAAGLASLVRLQAVDGRWLSVALALLVLTALASQYLVTQTAWYRRFGFATRTPRDLWRLLGPAWCSYALFCVGFGLSFVAVLLGTGLPLIGLSIPLIISASAAAWIAGFITPGAPGGIGVREATLILILSQSLGEPRLVLGVTLFRVASVLGDLLFYLIASLYVRASLGSDSRPSHSSLAGPQPSALGASQGIPQETSGLLSPWIRDIRLARIGPEIPRGSLVLDLGAGGMFLEGFLPAGCRYYAVDRYPRPVDEGRSVNYLALDLADPSAPAVILRWLPRAPDVITCIALLEHVADPAAFVARYAALLRPGGRFLGTTPHPRGRRLHDALAAVRLASPAAAAEHHRFLDRNDLERAAQASGGELTTYRPFLFGLNQLFVFEYPALLSAAVPA